MQRIADKAKGILRRATAFSNYLLLIPVYVIGVGASAAIRMMLRDEEDKGWKEARQDDDMRRLF
jgi:hypothetical protein